jgi:hypothetical protein
MNNPFKNLFNRHGSADIAEDIDAVEFESMNLVKFDHWMSQAGKTVAVPPGFQLDLEERLRLKAGRRADRFAYRQRNRRFAWAAAALTLVTVFFVLVLPLLQRGTERDPLPTAPMVDSDEQTPELIEATVPASLDKALIAFLGSVAQAESSTGDIFSGTELTLTAPYPETPAEAPVYEMLAQPITSAEQAKTLAAALGIDGEVYLSDTDGGGNMYYVTDGLQQVTFIESATRFTYDAHFGVMETTSPDPLPLAERAAIARAFLDETGLLDFDVKVDETLSVDDRVVLTPILDGRPLYENDVYNPRIEVSVNGAGEVTTLRYNMNKRQPLGEYPLRSAQEAWNIFLADPDDQRVRYTITDLYMAVRDLEPAWRAATPLGERVDVYAYLDVYRSAEPGGDPWVTAGGLTLQGDLAGLLAADDRPYAMSELNDEQRAQIDAGLINEKQAMAWPHFFHIWGESYEEANGARVMQVEGWEVSPVPDLSLTGSLSAVNGEILFIDDAGRWWTVLDLPTDVPLDTAIQVRGTQTDVGSDTLRWQLIQVLRQETPTGGSMGVGGGGGGGGGMGFSPDPDAPPDPTPTPEPMPYEVGDPVEELVGTLYVSRIVQSDGNTVTFATLTAPLPDDPQSYRSYQLLGEDLQALDGLHQLHLRVWGTYTQTEEGLPAIDLLRYEKAYPKETIQAWLGDRAVVDLGGRKVMLFTDTAGQQYVLFRSLTTPEEVPEDFFEGSRIILEGALTQETYAGLPVIREMGSRPAAGITDLDDYDIQAGEIYEQPAYNDPITDNKAGGINIGTAELAYFAYDLSHGGGGLPLDESPARFVQPVWQFSGTLRDGRLVEVLVQAVTDEYLH